MGALRIIPIVAAAIVISTGLPDPARAQSANTHGVILVGASHCPWCHRAAMALHVLSERDGLVVLPVSTDGGALGPYETVLHDPDGGARRGVAHVPAIFVYSASSGRAVLASLGFRSLAALERELAHAIRRLK